MRRVTLLEALPEVIDYVGTPVRAAGWYGPTKGLHTVAIQTLNFQGSLVIEGTLAVVPTELDWFALPLGGVPMLTFPRWGSFPTYGPGWGGESVTLGFNIVVNCLFLRARMIRSGLIPPLSTEQYISVFGSIDSIVVQY